VSNEGGGSYSCTEMKHVTDLFTGQKHERSGDEMSNPGLYVDLPAHGGAFLMLDQSFIDVGAALMYLNIEKKPEPLRIG